MDLRIVIFVAYCVVATSAMSWTKKHKKRSFMGKSVINIVFLDHPAFIGSIFFEE